MHDRFDEPLRSDGSSNRTVAAPTASSTRKSAERGAGGTRVPGRIHNYRARHSPFVPLGLTCAAPAVATHSSSAHKASPFRIGPHTIMPFRWRFSHRAVLRFLSEVLPMTDRLADRRTADHPIRSGATAATIHSRQLSILIRPPVRPKASSPAWTGLVRARSPSSRPGRFTGTLMSRDFRLDVRRRRSRHLRNTAILLSPARAQGYPAARPAGSEELIEAYQIRARRATDAKIGSAERTTPGTIDALCVSYFRSSDWTVLAEDTRDARRRIIEKFRLKHGPKRVRLIEEAHLVKIMNDIARRRRGGRG